MRISDWSSDVCSSDLTEAELLARAAALEARSTHPLAKAITRLAARQGVIPAAAENVQVLKGRGLTGMFEDELFWLGSYRYAIERGQGALDVAERVDNWVTDGKTVILIGNARHICGLIAVADTVRPDARETIALLHTAGIGRRSEEHTSELQSLMRISYAVFCLKKKNTQYT